MTRLDLDEEAMVRMYVDRKMSAPQIADKLGCSDTTVRKYLRLNGIGIRTPGESNKLDLDTDLLIDMYVGRKMSAPQIADKLRCNKITVCNHLRRAGVNIRASSESHELNLDMSLLVRMYVDQKMTTAQIAEQMGCTNVTVCNRLRKHGVALRPGGSLGYIDDWTHPYPLRFGSGWEAHVYKVLLGGRNRRFLFQGEFGARKAYCTPKIRLNRPADLPKRHQAKTKNTYLWHPDFMIPFLGVIIEVKGGWRARQKWNQCIIPCIRATPDLGYEVYEMGVDPYKIQSLAELKKTLVRIA